MEMYSAKYLKTLIAIVLVIFTAHFQAYSQTYQVNGAAEDKGNGLVRMTASQNSINQTSSVWSTTKINLNQPFDMSFAMFFGCNKDSTTGGDGMTFTFHNDLRGLNAIGEQYGFLGYGSNDPNGIRLKPALAIEFDTYNGASSGGGNEISADHIAVDINGDINQLPIINGGSGPISFNGTNGAATVQAINGGRDLEDCAGGSFYKIRVVWNPTARTLQLYEDGVLTMTYSNDIINTIFGGSSMVYWGFTGATGTASNEQWIAPKDAIIPWECTPTTSCCLPFTVTSTSPTTICNNPITLSVDSTYNSYYWFNGTKASTTQVTAPGTYTLNVLKSRGRNLCPGSATFTITPTGPTAVLSGGTTLCNRSQTAPLSVAFTGSAPWTIVYAKDGINQPAISGITSSPYVIQANGSHFYSLVSVSDNSGCNGIVSGSAVVDLYPGIPVGYDDVFIAPGSTSLSVDNNGGTYVWYDSPTGGTLVNTGLTFTTPTLTSATTYYIENTSVANTIRRSVGLFNTTDPLSSGNLNMASNLGKEDCFLDFSANTSFTFDTVTCAVKVPSGFSGTGRIAVYMTSYTGALGTFTIGNPETLIKDSINIPINVSGIQNIKIPLNFSCLAGTNYHISYTSLGNTVTPNVMYWDLIPNAGPGPYNITRNPEVTITQHSSQISRYTGLFDWQISVPNPSASCVRTPVTATPLPPTVSLFIPNLITPNHDGKNDRFEILGLPQGSTLGIYNRWGNAIYQSDNYDNQWAAENTSSGVYYYDLKLKNGDLYKGWLQIIP